MAAASPFVKLLEIVNVIPCLADPDKIRFTANFDRDVAEVFPYLNTILKGAIYNHGAKTLTVRKEGRLITLHRTSVSAAKIASVQDAQQVVAWLTDLVNQCHAKRATITPNYDRRDRLNVIDVVKLLPGTNCKKCGQATCLSFAALLTAEKASVLTCSELFLADYQEKREELLALLRAGGYPLPDVFH